MKQSYILACALAAVLVAAPAARARDWVRIGGSVVVEAEDQVQDAVAVGGDVTVYGEVRGSAVAIGGDVLVKAGGNVGSDAVAIGGRLVVEPGGEVVGSQVEVDREAIPKALGWAAVVPVMWGPLKGLYWLGKIIALVALGALLFTFLPAHVGTMADEVEHRPWKSLGVGFLGIIALPPLMALVALTIIGIPLIPLIIMAVAVALLFGHVGVGYLVGRKIPWEAIKGRSPLLGLAVGMVLLSLASEVPWLGWLVWCVAALLGFGAVLSSRFGTVHGPVASTPPPR